MLAGFLFVRAPSGLEAACKLISWLRWPGAEKNLADEPEKVGFRIAPRAHGQLRFAAGFGQELPGGQVVIDRNLGKQQAPMGSLHNKQAVAADFDFFGADGVRCREK